MSRQAIFRIKQSKLGVRVPIVLVCRILSMFIRVSYAWLSLCNVLWSAERYLWRIEILLASLIEWRKTGHFEQRTNGYFISLLLEEQLSVFLHYDCTVVSSVQWGYLT